MADGLYWGNRIRSYEVSIWTLQERLFYETMEHRNFLFLFLNIISMG